jgi:hypothetical protein
LYALHYSLGVYFFKDFQMADADIPTEPEPAPVPDYIATLDELLSSTEATAKKESDDRSVVRQISEPNAMALRTKLLEWASLGFPDAYEILSITLVPPRVCTDGQVRTKFDYLTYLLGMQLGDQLRIVEQKLPGMLLSYSTPGDRVCIHVTRAQSS